MHSANDHSDRDNRFEQARAPPEAFDSCTHQWSCGSCTQKSGCVWCGSSSICMPSTDEIRGKDSSILYYSQEYTRSYGGQPSASVGSSIDSRCLLWITKPSTCNTVSNSCASLRSCQACIQRPGCGYCPSSARCMPGTRESALGFSHFNIPSARCGVGQSQWIFGNWGEYSRGESFDLKGCNYTFYRHAEVIAESSPAPNDLGLPVHYLVFIVVFACIAFLCITRLLARFFPHVFVQPAVIVARCKIPSRSLDISKLEELMPSCRAIVLGCRKTKDENEHDLEDGSDALCSVCLAPLEEGDEARKLPCEHLFHKCCIDVWLDKSIQCPVCRRDIEKMAGLGTPEKLEDVPGESTSTMGESTAEQEWVTI